MNSQVGRMCSTTSYVLIVHNCALNQHYPNECHIILNYNIQLLYKYSNNILSIISYNIRCQPHHTELPSKEGNLRKILFDRSVRKEVDVMDTSVGNSSYTGIANMSVDDVINDVKNNKNDDTKNINNKSNNHDTHSTSHSNKENINSNNNLGLNVSDVFMTSYREGDSALMGDSLHHHSSPSSSSSSLPLCKSQHADLNSISHDTVRVCCKFDNDGYFKNYYLYYINICIIILIFVLLYKSLYYYINLYIIILLILLV